MASILDGVHDIIDTMLQCGVGTPPRYRHRTNYLALDISTLDGRLLVEEIYAQMCRNVNGRTVERAGSRENWRWAKQTCMNECNPSREKRLEKVIARAAGDDWVNQIPTASGVMGSQERHRNLDLAHRIACGEYEFIELKVSSDTPLYAAMEILCYGLIYLCSRRYATTLGYRADNELLRASRAELKVLAPLAYYADRGRRDELWRLQEKLHAGLESLLSGRCANLGVQMGFRFEAFPDECAWETEQQVLALLERRCPLYRTSGSLLASRP
jgi:hypothetical protein